MSTIPHTNYFLFTSRAFLQLVQHSSTSFFNPMCQNIINKLVNPSVGLTSGTVSQNCLSRVRVTCLVQIRIGQTPSSKTVFLLDVLYCLQASNLEPDDLSDSDGYFLETLQEDTSEERGGKSCQVHCSSWLANKKGFFSRIFDRRQTGGGQKSWKLFIVATYPLTPRPAMKSSLISPFVTLTFLMQSLFLPSLQQR